MQSSRESRLPKRAGGFEFWTAVAALSGAGAVASVRLATPPTLDEIWTTVVLFFVLPSLLILALGRAWRAAGVTISVLMPVIWLLVAREASDSPLLWLVPAGAAVLIVLAAWRAARRPVPPAFAVASVLLALASLLWPAPGRPVEGPRVVVVGVDGATWGRIDPLVAAGRLPHFATAAEGGHRATLRSLTSLFSPQVWSTIATGCPPAVHGIEDFANRQSDFQVGRIWDQMRAEGRTFGVCGWFFTWPPPSNLGEHDFVIPSTFAPDSQAFPPEYSFFWRIWVRERHGREQAISYPEAGLRAFQLGVRLSTLRRALLDLADRQVRDRTARDQYWRSRRIFAAFQGDIFAELVRRRRPEFAAVLFKPVDSVSHMYWKYLEPEGFPEVADTDRARYGGVIDELYVEIDRNLGKILESSPEDVDLLVVSDHGFQPLSRGRIADRFCRIRTENLIAALGLTQDLFGTNVDDRVYLRALSRSPEERDELLDRLQATLADARLSGEAEPVFDVVREGGVVCLTLAPRPGLTPDAHIVLDRREHPFEDLIRIDREAVRSGAHHPDGVYLLSGPSATRSTRADSLHVLDVAPTVAALLDLPTSPLWPGRPAVEGGSTPDVRVAEYPPPSESPSEPREIDWTLKEKLKALGYLE